MKHRKNQLEIYGYFNFVVFQFYVIVCYVQYQMDSVEAVSIFAEHPKFEEPINNVTVALGRDASLQCVVSNLASYKVAWLHLDRQMILTIDRHVISRLPKFTVTHDNQKTWILNIENAQAEDRGFYMCQVNTNPMISQVGFLQVVVPPNIVDEESTLSSVAVRENQNLTLFCKATGFPQPKISWKREDGTEIWMDRKRQIFKTTHSGPNITIARISRTDMGAYLCIASNAVPPSVSKRIIVDVEFVPFITVPNQLVNAPTNTDVTIDCLVEAHPRAINYWAFGDDVLITANKHTAEYIESGYKTHMKLTVSNIQQNDFGTYKCISKNSLGDTEGNIRIYELTMPSASPQEREAMISRAETGYEDVTKSSKVQPTKPIGVKVDVVRKHARQPSLEKKQSFSSGSSKFNWSERIRWFVIAAYMSKFLY